MAAARAAPSRFPAAGRRSSKAKSPRAHFSPTKIHFCLQSKISPRAVVIQNSLNQNMKKNTLKSLHIRNLLSFGEDSPKIELGDLNVLIGPNGSGKSNLIEIIGLLRSTPKDFAAEV